MEMLEIKNMNVTYPNGYRAINNVNLSLEEGKIYGVLGPSGSGKSSFLKGMLGLVDSTGEVKFRNRSIREFAKKTAYVEQKENIDRDFPITVFQCVLLGTYPGLGLFHRPGKREREKVREALEEVQMWDYRHRQIGELSGGQFQRVLIARALVQDATLIFMDEPFVGIDVQNEAILIRQLKKLVSTGKTIFVVHHDLTKVHDYFDEVILIHKVIISAGPLDQAFTMEHLASTYGVPSSAFRSEAGLFQSEKS